MACGGSLLITARPISLVGVPSCQGLFDLAVVIGSRTWGDLSIGTLLAALNSALVFGGLLVLGRLLLDISASRATTLAVGLAAATSWWLQPTLAPTPASALAACGLCWFACSPLLFAHGASAPRGSMRSIGWLALATAVTPALATPLAIAAGWLVWRANAGATVRARMAWMCVGVLGVLAAATLISIALTRASAATAVAACVSVASPLTAATAAATEWPQALGATPLALAFAALGLWASVPPRRGTRVGAAFLGALLVGTTFVLGKNPGTIAPAMLFFWTLVALGVNEARAALVGTRARQAGAIALVTALAVLQSVHLWSATRVVADPLGHQTLSRNRLVDLVRPMPDQSALVADDASVDLLFRALPGQVRARGLEIIGPDARAIDAHQRTNRVYALPHGQARLQHLGLRLVAVPESPGLAEVLPGGACSAPLTGQWRLIPEMAGLQQFTLAAGDADSRGPVYVFMSSESPIGPRPLDWPAEALRGFHPLGHDLTAPDHADRLRRDLADYALTLDAFEDGSVGPHLARIEMWRTTAAPRQLSVELQAPARRMLARLSEESAGTLSLCPSYSYEIVPIATQQRN